MATRAEPPVVERRLRVPAAELCVRETGTGQPLLLLHGWPQDGRMWEPLIGDLSERYRVLVPDLRGFGNSEAPRGDYSKHSLAEDVLALLDAEGIERVTIVGHDWGGWIAWLLALEHPERVGRFAALDIPPPGRLRASPARLPGALLFGSYQYLISAPLLGERLVSSERAISAFIRSGGGSRGGVSAASADRYARAIARPERAHVSVALYRTFLLRELPAIARGTYTERELTVPGLCVMGGESSLTKLLGVPEEEANLRVEVLPGAGHFLVDEAPRQVLAQLLPFLGDGSPR